MKRDTGQEMQTDTGQEMQTVKVDRLRLVLDRSLLGGGGIVVEALETKEDSCQQALRSARH